MKIQIEFELNYPHLLDYYIKLIKYYIRDGKYNFLSFLSHEVIDLKEEFRNEFYKELKKSKGDYPNDDEMKEIDNKVNQYIEDLIKLFSLSFVDNSILDNLNRVIKLQKIRKNK